MFWRTLKKITSQKNGVVKAMALEIRNEKLMIDNYIIGDEERLLQIFDKANKYDEIVKSGFLKTGGEL